MKVETLGAEVHSRKLTVRSMGACAVDDFSGDAAQPFAACRRQVPSERPRKARDTARRPEVLQSQSG